jgi:hypothetical protein
MNKALFLGILLTLATPAFAEDVKVNLELSMLECKTSETTTACKSEKSDRGDVTIPLTVTQQSPGQTTSEGAWSYSINVYGVSFGFEIKVLKIESTGTGGSVIYNVTGMVQDDQHFGASSDQPGIYVPPTMFQFSSQAGS